MELVLPRPSPRQAEFLADTHKYVAYGGARGGGKSWAIRVKSVLLACAWPGITVVIIRRSYPELRANHITPFLRLLPRGAYGYSETRKELVFPGGSRILFRYCADDRDLGNFQGTECDVLCIDEATQFTEEQFRVLTACLRGTNRFPKRVYLTCNPGGVGHAWVKRLFIDRAYHSGENGEEYAFHAARVYDNAALMAAQPEYVRQLEALPKNLREMWLLGRWDVFSGQFFEEFRAEPDEEKCAEAGITLPEARRTGRWTHVIDPFPPPREWNILRSYDFGYARPFSCGWWAVDCEGVLYRILELYGCAGEPNEGVRWTPDRQFEEIARLEREHPWLRGRRVTGVADPAIWDASRGESVAETAARRGVYFTPGDHQRIPGWMQCHYRLQFDAEGFARCYVFRGCEAFIRTVPLMRYDAARPEDLDTDGEDHVCDEWRYLCMSRPVSPRRETAKKAQVFSPLDSLTGER